MIQKSRHVLSHPSCPVVYHMVAAFSKSPTCVLALVSKMPAQGAHLDHLELLPRLTFSISEGDIREHRWMAGDGG